MQVSFLPAMVFFMMIWAGTPPATVMSGTSFVATAPASRSEGLDAGAVGIMTFYRNKLRESLNGSHTPGMKQQHGPHFDMLLGLEAGGHANLLIVRRCQAENDPPKGDELLGVVSPEQGI